jgi:hypothetical protein
VKGDEKYIHAGSTTRQLYRKEVEKSQWGETISRLDDGIEVIDFKVFLDVQEVGVLARKAAANKSGQSRAGALRVVVTKRQREQA